MARITLKDSGVIFNKENHTYELNGKMLQGITTMLQRQLFSTEYEGIPWAIVKKAGEYGSQVHDSCEDFDKNWNNDGSQEVQDYISICKEYGFTHEASEYTVTDGVNFASNIDKVFRVSDNTFDLADLKTYGKLTADKLEKACIDTIESGVMTKDLYLISTLENKTQVNTVEFLEAIASRL